MKYNLLKQWKSDFYEITSPLAFKNTPDILRINVDMIFDELCSFFGISYFEVEGSDFLRKQEINFSQNSILRIISSRDTSSYFMLLDFACLLKFSGRLIPQVIETLLGLKYQPDRLRDRLFEVMILRFFISNGINVVPNPTFQGKEVEGFFRWEGFNCTIECKKLYSVENNRLKFLHWGHQVFLKKWLKFQPEIFAFIFCPNTSDEEINSDKTILLKGIKEYFQEVKKRSSYKFKFEKFNSKGQKILQVEERNVGLFENLQILNNAPYYYFIVSVPELYSSDRLNINQTKFGFNFSMDLDEIHKKFKKEVSKKNKQHPIIDNQLRFFFFENELPSFVELPLLPHKEIGKISLTKYLESIKENNIICLINKNFSKKGMPEISLNIFCKSELNHIKEKIKEMNFTLFLY